MKFKWLIVSCSLFLLIACDGGSEKMIEPVNKVGKIQLTDRIKVLKDNTVACELGWGEVDLFFPSSKEGDTIASYIIEFHFSNPAVDNRSLSEKEDIFINCVEPFFQKKTGGNNDS